MPFTLAQLAETLERSAVRVEPALSAELRVTGEVVKKLAQEMIGHEHDAWPSLATSTISDKERKGFPTPDPLLRTGSLRDSIETGKPSD